MQYRVLGRATRYSLLYTDRAICQFHTSNQRRKPFRRAPRTLLSNYFLGIKTTAQLDTFAVYNHGIGNLDLLLAAANIWQGT
jgi:hypothetical protein